jgi:NADP-dependent 3-hydroxy acid dehydrogenase YdfG
MKEFRDKVAVITGAASGIGRGIANRAVREGMKVVLADIEADRLAQAKKELKAKGTDVISVLTDVSKAEEVEILAKKTLDAFGEVHLLCNNAGVAPFGISWEGTLSDWKWIMDVNLWGVIHGTRTFIPLMLQQDTECHIVNTASLSGLMSNEIGQGMYIATKYGVVGLTEIIAKELSLLKSKIKVHTLCPGMVKTNIIDCERNRPADLCDDICDEIDHPELEKIGEAIHELADSGESPDRVGDIVFEAIKQDVFYIFTDTKLSFRRMIQTRNDEIMEAFKQNKLIHKSLEKASEYK